MNKNRTLNDFTVEELKGLMTDLQNGVRYNDLKIKYNIPRFTFTHDTYNQCKKLIEEKSPKPAPTDVNLNTWYDDTGEMHYGMKPDPRFPWTNPDFCNNYIQHTTPEGWYMPAPGTEEYGSFMTAKANNRLDEWYKAIFSVNYETARIVKAGEMIFI